MGRRVPLAAEKLITGLGASPGRAVGRVVFGTEGRTPDEVENAVLVAPAVRPEDTIFLYRCAAIVSTGGGILSHAGLIALQFRKPALIIRGQWDTAGSRSLRYVSREYREEEKTVAGYRVYVRHELRDREYRLREGDLVAVDAGEGVLRVLGQDSDVLGFHEALKHFGKSTRSLSVAGEDREILALRGRQLRALHQIEKILRRITDPVLADHAVYELLLGDVIPEDASADQIRLLRLVLGNPRIGDMARESLLQISGRLKQRFHGACDKARKSIPSAASLWEVLQLRLDAQALYETVAGARASLVECGIEAPRPDACLLPEIERIARSRLLQLSHEGIEGASRLLESGQGTARLRHTCNGVLRVFQLLGCAPEQQDVMERMRRRLFLSDDEARRKMSTRRIVASHEAGFELARLIGWKAANLAELETLAGTGLVPPWFVVADRAFEEVLQSPLEEMAPVMKNLPAHVPTVRNAIDFILGQPGLTSAQKSDQIRALWEVIVLPDRLRQELVESYRRITDGAPAGSTQSQDRFVAVRSSAREEDTEVAARAGEFETFLFISGEQPLVEHLKRTWSGLWTERAIHNRTVMGPEPHPAGGGVIVQRMVWSRVAGVLQTVNAAQGNLDEMIINAGHGLGEGIVSGTVAADHITVVKDASLETGPLRFRYVTSDKHERVVFNRRAGQGTVRTETLYHQRLRPALEYVELCELVAVAARLEKAYGYPLDIEFAIEGTKLWILQARPVASVLSSFRRTLERYPFNNRSGEPGLSAKGAIAP